MRKLIKTGAVLLLSVLLSAGCGQEDMEKDFAVKENIIANNEEKPVEEDAQISMVEESEDVNSEEDMSQDRQEESISEGIQEEPKEEAEVVDKERYFDDALFIGDSRTVGLREYGVFKESDFFASPGMSVYSVNRTKADVNEHKEITLEELLDQKDYGKIYLMLGMNELGYDFEQTVERYRLFVEDLMQKEPEAQIYLCANMHVTIVRSENDAIYNNENINRINEEIRLFAEEQNMPYLDVNALFDDEKGNLDVLYTSDDSHVLGKYYADWCEWLANNIYTEDK